MVFSATFNNISVTLWQSVLLVEETRVSGKKPPTGHKCILTKESSRHNPGPVVVMLIWYLDLQIPIQSVPITTKVMSLNPVHGEAYMLQHYVIKFVSDLWPVGGFFPDTLVSSTNKTDCHNVTEILLKVALNTINLNP
jgi:hypothetical protein